MSIRPAYRKSRPSLWNPQAELAVFRSLSEPAAAPAARPFQGKVPKVPGCHSPCRPGPRRGPAGQVDGPTPAAAPAKPAARVTKVTGQRACERGQSRWPPRPFARVTKVTAQGAGVRSGPMAAQALPSVGAVVGRPARQSGRGGGWRSVHLASEGEERHDPRARVRARTARGADASQPRGRRPCPALDRPRWGSSRRPAERSGPGRRAWTFVQLTMSKSRAAREKPDSSIRLSNRWQVRKCVFRLGVVSAQSGT